MPHYYTDNQNLASQPRMISFDYKGEKLQFNSDIGVFSKNTIDFGTRVLLDTFKPLSHVKLLDVGCGYGVIGLSLAKVGTAVVADLVDVNTRAIDLAKENAKQLQLKDVHVFESSCYENVSDQYDLIVSNPPIRAGKIVVHTILEGAYAHLRQNGKLRVVIQKKQGAPSAKAKMETVFGNCEILKKEKGYYILESIKK